MRDPHGCCSKSRRSHSQLPYHPPHPKVLLGGAWLQCCACPRCALPPSSANHARTPPSLSTLCTCSTRMVPATVAGRGHAVGEVQGIVIDRPRCRLGWPPHSTRPSPLLFWKPLPTLEPPLPRASPITRIERPAAPCCPQLNSPNNQRPTTLPFPCWLLHPCCSPAVRCLRQPLPGIFPR